MDGCGFWCVDGCGVWVWMVGAGVGAATSVGIEVASIRTLHVADS